MESRIEKIRNAAKRRDIEAAEKECRVINRVSELKEKISVLTPRINSLIEVGKELLQNDIPFGRVVGRFNWFNEGEFETEGINHRYGFKFKYNNGRRVDIIGIGEAGGGCCGDDFFVGLNGKIITQSLERKPFYANYNSRYSDFIGKATSFLNGFDEFERKFYAYVDSL